jgi:dTDP-4-amino-4,6-dideoxygalactose transaminase
MWLKSEGYIALSTAQALVFNTKLDTRNNRMKTIPLFKSYTSWRAIWKACNVMIRSNYGGYLGEGPEVKAFEREFGNKFGFENVASLNSGSVALELAYELAGIGEFDEVIVPVLTHPSSALPAVRRRAKVIFADIDFDLNVSIQDVERKITPKTKALMFVHFGGNNRGLKEMLELSRKYGLILIEDAAQAVGTTYWGKADFTCVSLQAIKTLTSGDGGFLICQNKNHHERAKRLRWFGYDRDLKQQQGDTDLVEAGFKYHMNDITAAFGMGNLVSIDPIIAHRRRLCNVYARHGVPASLWFAHTLTSRRSELKALLREEGVHTGEYHYRCDKYTIFGGKMKLPVMDTLESQYLLLPVHHRVSLKDVQRICSLLQKFRVSN